MSTAPAISLRASLGQLLPPLALFAPLLATDGSVLLLGLVAVVVVLVISAARLAWLAWRRPPPGTRWLRAVLACAFALATLGLAWMEFAPTPRYAGSLARALQAQCRGTGRCPGRIAGWREVDGGSDVTLGKRVRYRIAYRSDGHRFRMCWEVAFGRCRSATGGVDAPFAALAPWPWPQLGAAGAPP